MSTVMQEQKPQQVFTARADMEAVMRLALEPTREQLRLVDLEAQAGRLCMAPMADLARNHPEWMAHYDDVEPDTADIADLMALLETAPNGFAQGIIYGKLMMRTQAAAMGCQPA